MHMMTCVTRKKKPKFLHDSASADLIGGNVDLIDQILIYLPVRSLIRFKCVSKQWNSLISDHRFGLTHTLKNPSSRIPCGLFFYYTTREPTVYSVPISKNLGTKFPCSSHDSIRIVQSCNGLNLLRLEHCYCVCNLVTNQFDYVPFPKLYPSAREGSWFLAFDPSVSSYYKILCVQQVEYRIKYLIFSSETRRWKDTDVTTYEDRLPGESAKGVYLHGSIYFLVFPYYTWQCYRFDVEAEELTTILLPSSRRYFCSSYFRYFGGFNGHLHLVYVRDVSAKRFNVLELDHVNEKWFVKYRVHINRLVSRFPEVAEKTMDDRCEYAFSILSVVRGEKEEDSALVLAIPGKVVSYNLKSKKFEVLSRLPLQEIGMNFLYQTSVRPFIATLFPL